MQKDAIAFIDLDTSKMKVSVALAADGRQSEAWFFGDIDSTSDAVRRLVGKLSGKDSNLSPKGRSDTLARLHRAGELTAIWVPDPEHEAVRDLVRAREAAMEDLREKRQHLQSDLLRHGPIIPVPGLGRRCMHAGSPPSASRIQIST